MRWWRWLAAASVCAVGLVAGCSGDPGEPRVLPSLTATPSPSTTPTAASDLEAATQVVRKYYSLLNAATTSANADALAALMTASCKCREVAQSTREVAAKHQHYFGEILLTSVLPSINGKAAADVLVHYDYTASGVADADGQVVRSSPGRKGIGVDFRLVREKSDWLIAEILTVSPGRLG